MPAYRKRDYSITGDAAKLAEARGLASAEWYHTDVPRAELKALMQRTDGPATINTAIWFGALIVSAAGAIWLWGSWWCVPFFFVYGTMYGSASDARWHEGGHGTAFKTAWKNKLIYQIACFMLMRNPVTWKWSHARHHTDTIIVGRDLEIAVMRPPDLLRVVLNFVGIFDVWYAVQDMVRNAAGNLSPAELEIIPKPLQKEAIGTARIWLVIYAVVIVAAIVMRSWLPLMLIGLPRFYGAWHMVLVGLLQHGGLAEDVTDHRLNSRTVLMNPVSRFIYMNMNYHVEHHMFPMVPFHALPKLHELIKHDLVAPSPSIFAAYREMVPAFLKQLRYENYYVRRDLPPTAKPYREDLNDAAVIAVGKAAE